MNDAEQEAMRDLDAALKSNHRLKHWLALNHLLPRYIEFVNRGDAGFRNPEEEPEVKEARGVLKP